MKILDMKLVSIMSIMLIITLSSVSAFSADITSPLQDEIVNRYYASLVTETDNAAMCSYNLDGTGWVPFTDSFFFKFDKVDNHLNYYESIGDIYSSISSAEVPRLLGDKEFRDHEGNTDNEEMYTQTLALHSESNKVVFDNANDNDETAGTYLLLNDADNAYTYSLLFDNPIDYDTTNDLTIKEDFVGSEIEIMETVYEITNVEVSGGIIYSINLISGETVVWLQNGHVYPWFEGMVEHQIEIIDVGDNETTCGVSVDGNVTWIPVGQTYSVNGVTIGVLDAIDIKSELQDMSICKLALGAVELEIPSDGNEVERNGAQIGGSSSYIRYSSALGELYGIDISYTPDEDMYIAIGSEFTDPVFGEFTFFFRDIDADYEDIGLNVNGATDAELTFYNIGGDLIEIPWIYDSSTGVLQLGEDENIPNAMITDDVTDNTCVGSMDVYECEGVLLLAVESSKVHILEITNINLIDQEVDIDDRTTGMTYNDVPLYITIDGIDINIALNDSTLTVTKLGDWSDMETEHGATITVNDDTITFTEDDAEDEDDSITLTVGLTNNADDEIEIISPVASDTATHSSSNWDASQFVLVKESDLNTDERYETTEYGTFVHYNLDTKDILELKYPLEQVKANVFINSISSSLVHMDLLAGIQPGDHHVDVECTSIDDEFAIDSVDFVLIPPCVDIDESNIVLNYNTTFCEGWENIDTPFIINKSGITITCEKDTLFKNGGAGTAFTTSAQLDTARIQDLIDGNVDPAGLDQFIDDVVSGSNPIEDLTIKGCNFEGFDIALDLSGVRNAVVEDNDISGGQVGLILIGENVDVTGNSIENMTDGSLELFGQQISGVGIVAGGRYLDIFENKVNLCSKGGIGVLGTYNNVTSNTISQIGQVGLGGIVLKDSMLNLNNITNSNSGIGLLWSFDNTLRNNRIEDNFDKGLSLVETAGNLIEFNNINRNSVGIASLGFVSPGPSKDNEIRNNTIVDNTQAGLYMNDKTLAGFFVALGNMVKAMFGSNDFDIPKGHETVNNTIAGNLFDNHEVGGWDVFVDNSHDAIHDNFFYLNDFDGNGVNDTAALNIYCVGGNGNNYGVGAVEAPGDCPGAQAMPAIVSESVPLDTKLVGTTVKNPKKSKSKKVR